MSTEHWLAVIITAAIIIVYFQTSISSKTRNLHKITIDEYEKIASAGDVVFMFTEYDNRSTILNIIKRFRVRLESAILGENFTHVGVVVDINGIKYIYSSDASAQLDLYTRTWKSGSQLLPLNTIKKYGEYAWVYRIINEPSPLVDVKHILEKHQNKHWDINGLSLLVKAFRGAALDPQKLICTQLCIEVLNEYSVPINAYSKEWIPFNLEKYLRNTDLYHGEPIGIV